MRVKLNTYPLYGMVTHHVSVCANRKIDQIKGLITSNEHIDWYRKPGSFPYGINFSLNVYPIDSKYIPDKKGNGTFKVKTEIGYMFFTSFNTRYARYSEVFLPINHWIALKVHDIDVGDQKEAVSFCKRLGKMIKPIMDQDNEVEW